MLNAGKLELRVHEVGDRKLLFSQDVMRHEQDILQQLDPVKSEMAQKAQERAGDVKRGRPGAAVRKGKHMEARSRP